MKQRFADLGTEPVAEERATPEALRAHLKAEIDKWAPIIKKAGVYADETAKDLRSVIPGKRSLCHLRRRRAAVGMAGGTRGLGSALKMGPAYFPTILWRAARGCIGVAPVRACARRDRDERIAAVRVEGPVAVYVARLAFGGPASEAPASWWRCRC